MVARAKRPKRPEKKRDPVSELFEWLPFKRDPRPVWRRVDAGKGLTLREAMLFYGDPNHAQTFYELEQSGYGGDPPDTVGADGWPIPHEEIRDFDIKSFRLQDLRVILERSLLKQLRSGQLVATGYASTAPLDAPAARIVADRWRTLTPDFTASEASGPGGLVISGLLVFKAGHDKREVRPKPAFSAAKLRVWYLDWIGSNAKGGTTPSRDEDWSAARAALGSEVSREAVRSLRRELAPAEWTRLGRRKRRE
jgi:hypothetical protein